MVIEVKSPPGSGAFNVIRDGLEAADIPYRVFVCDCIEPGRELNALADPKLTAVLLGLERTRPDFRQQILDVVEMTYHKTFWIVGTK